MTFREKRDGVDEYYEGFAQRIVYDGQKRFVELFDNALLKKGSDQIRSNYISYDAETESFKAEGRPDSTTAVRGRSAARRAGSRRIPAGIEGSQGRQERQGRGRAPPATTSKPNPPLPLKPDDKIGPSVGK